MTAAEIVAPADLAALGERLRAAGRVVVWTNGCFDLFHAGHARSLRDAKVLGDVLVVGVNADATVRRLKGAARPLVPAADRAELVAAVRWVDYVMIFDEDTPEECLRRLRPAVHCKGADYAPPGGKPVPEAALVESYGGRVAFLPLIDGLSTSELVRRVQSLPG
jgi:rfaE bifunctional protein nucleotidyltransferase chain/domain